MDEPRAKLQRDEATPGYPRPPDSALAQVQAAVEAAGQASVGAVPRDIGYGAATAGHAVAGGAHGHDPSPPSPAGRGQPISIFDKQRPPPQDLIDDCVHCGFC